MLAQKVAPKHGWVVLPAQDERGGKLEVVLSPAQHAMLLREASLWPHFCCSLCRTSAVGSWRWCFRRQSMPCYYRYARLEPPFFLLVLQDEGGEKLEVLLAPSEDDLMEVQASARALGLPTHTFAGEPLPCTLTHVCMCNPLRNPLRGGASLCLANILV